jgi:hypothetical protein
MLLKRAFFHRSKAQLGDHRRIIGSDQVAEGDDAVIGRMTLLVVLTLIVTGTPCRGPRALPCARAASAASAATRASSSMRRTTAFNLSFTASIRARRAATASRLEAWPTRISLASSVASSGDVSLCVPTAKGYDGGFALEGRDRPASGLPSGHLSLLDMINFSLRSFLNILDLLDSERGASRPGARVVPPVMIEEAQKSQVINNIALISELVERLNLIRARDRIVHLGHIFGRPMLRYDELLRQLDVVRAILDDVKFEYFYHYSPRRAELYLSREKEWELPLRKFGSIKSEVDAAIDCFALEYYTASVFHLMRIAEYGLRALARERGVTFPRHPLEWADWQNILEQTEMRARDATKGMPRGPKKDAMQAFYNGAVGQLHGFKDTYRNVVMHVRRSYDELDALRAINQVRDFMNGLSVKIGEKTRRPISRWP